MILSVKARKEREKGWHFSGRAIGIICHIIIYPKAVTATPSPQPLSPPPPSKCHSGHQDHPANWDCFRLPSNDVQRETTESEGVWQTQEAGMCRILSFSVLSESSLPFPYVFFEPSVSFWNVMKNERRARLLRDISASILLSVSHYSMFIYTCSFSCGFVISACIFNW